MVKTSFTCGCIVYVSEGSGQGTANVESITIPCEGHRINRVNPVLPIAMNDVDDGVFRYP